MTDAPTYRRFLKLHGLRNDFVLFDMRKERFVLPVDMIRKLADRRAGIGCDQLLVLEPSDKADCRMVIYNADGSLVGACGNATRCVGDLLMREMDSEISSIETDAGILHAEKNGNQVRVNMGQPKRAWQDIPLSTEMDTDAIDLTIGSLSSPVGVNMGNPHAIFITPDADVIDLATLGPQIENHPLFPERVNVSIISMMNTGGIRLRVWERGTGITDACGTAACASLVAANIRGLVGQQADMHLNGGVLHIEWADDGNIYMTGAVSRVFEGQIAI